MVVKDSKSLFSLIEQFDPNNKDHLSHLEKLTMIYPNFHLLRVYYLKALQKQKVLSFDKNLSHTSIATYNRELLYQFIESDLTPKKSTKKNRKIQKGKSKKNISKNIIKERNIVQKIKNDDSPSKTLKFSEWASYLNSKKASSKKNNNLHNFQLIDDFLKSTERRIPDKDIKNKEDLSEKSWSSNDELMTETLAKVFVKQKKFKKAIEAYQILGLKYPEKNSLFANQIKKIKKLDQQKNS
ncbi:hypothetical protein DEJ39_03680 [Bacteroidetes bacterium SCGC AAA795-G10]|nr:hypothetical protein DEJ39_03680 [Bacteroidetes bacterium SCGC AAA795-G10]